MNIIAIDTLSSVITVAAQGSKGLAVQSFAGAGRSHAEQLVPIIASVVNEAGFTAEQTDLVLAPEGPGSFTGLRLGYAAAKALQLTNKSRFLPIPTLPCIAYQYHTWPEGIATVIDAKRERFYIQLFINGKPLTTAIDATPEELLPLLVKKIPWLITGYGTSKFHNAISSLADGIIFYALETPQVNFAQTMIAYAQTAYATADSVDSYAAPVYIRKSDAEKGSL